ncbi:MAG: carbamoyl-phosphate synthase large subunit [Eubacteriales bacterium]|nr:carbamoyl-phosphate synthase large subunit [Eubacteriales bacterium]
MPKRNDINTIMIIGSGPIIIGQACEFDYSGTQACKALRKLGYKIILVNSNPATIMTDPEMADTTYIEPLSVTRMTEIIAKERPDALLPNLGGQSALNLCSDLNAKGVLEKYGVKVIGVQVDAIERGEDRIAFKETMSKLGIDMPKSKPAYSVEEAEAISLELGFPVVIRPAYTMGGTGGGLVYNIEELRVVASRGISASLVGQILVEESVVGWEELELEVVRDSKGKMITVCFIENIDPMGVHTGDSICSAPMLTISKELQERLQTYAYKIVEAVQVIGGTNVQFAHDPVSDRVVIIEINPRTSRSSALASKATGFPIAYVSAMLAAGLTLDEIPYWRDGTLDKYTPSGDYVVIKFARWAFEKFKGSIDLLGTQMKAVGEVMSIGKTYKEALQKAVRSLEIGRFGFGFAANYNGMSLETLMYKLKQPTSQRQFIMYEALRKGADIEELHRLTGIKRYFIEQMKELVELEEEIISYKGHALPGELLTRAKKDGFADRYLAMLLNTTEKSIREQRIALGVVQTWNSVPVSGTENCSYYYSTYNLSACSSIDNNIIDNNSISNCSYNNVSDTRPATNKKKVMIIGGGPNRIGQGIEFDYCCVHAAFALRDLGLETIMVNCNPETVSTDYDTSDKLYFEPLTVEDVLSIYEKENPEGVIVQFGGQTPLNIARELEAAGVKILGTSPDTIDLAEDRDKFRHMMDEMGIPMPESGMAINKEEAIKIAGEIGYPLMVRPSYVLGGRGMEVVHDEESLVQYMAAAVDVTPERPILIDRFLENAIECESDAIADGSAAFVPAVMEHIELAGIHSGDSACVIPSISISKEHLDTICEYTEKIARKLNVVGLMNMQYAIENDKVYVLEANPRASRTVPLVSKVCNIRMARIATQLMVEEILNGKTLANYGLDRGVIPHYGAKEAVFPFNMFPEVDPVLGPEMRSTGEVLGLAESFGLAFFKAQEATGTPLPSSGKVLISVADVDKEAVIEAVKIFVELGFGILATSGTCDFLKQRGIQAERINKIFEGRPDIADGIKNREIQLVVNTPVGKRSQNDDSYIRKAAIRYKVPYITTVAAAIASAKGIAAHMEDREGRKSSVKSLQQFHSEIIR